MELQTQFATHTSGRTHSHQTKSVTDSIPVLRGTVHERTKARVEKEDNDHTKEFGESDPRNRKGLGTQRLVTPVV